MSYNDYRNALRQGQREYRACMSRGEYPYLQTLDELLEHEKLRGESSLGLVEIPMELIAGTKTVGRRSAFARNFMPLIEGESEFSAKWSALSDAHLEEGIRDPIVAYEFLNRFYVLEGNKRVSVLKYFGAATVTGAVTRLLPEPRDTMEYRVYNEFLDFYRLTRLNDIYFRRSGCFRTLLAEMGREKEPWTAQERKEFSAAWTIFRRAFASVDRGRADVTEAEGLLAYLKLYGAQTFLNQGEAEIREGLTKSWREIAAGNAQVELFLTPEPTPPRTILDRLRKPAPVKVAFLHARNAEVSRWTDSHELGRARVEEALEGRVSTCCFDGVTSENAAEKIEQAVEDGNQVIFTTTPRLMQATIRAAVEHPDLKFLNCSLNMPHPAIRTYYGRMYEAKFLSGVIAGALSHSGKIGYIADYPICGMTANINAFALGARMVNPRSEIHLEWTSQRDVDGILARFHELGADVISNQDLLSPRLSKRDFGLYYMHGGTVGLMAVASWNWGSFYELILRSILDGGWRVPAGREPARAVNYWWGLSAGVVELRYTENLPIGTRRLVEFLRQSLIAGTFRPFAGKLYATGRQVVQEDGELTAAEIVQMDWLAENVVGEIPPVCQLTGEAQALVALQGIHRADEEGGE